DAIAPGDVPGAFVVALGPLEIVERSTGLGCDRLRVGLELCRRRKDELLEVLDELALATEKGHHPGRMAQGKQMALEDDTIEARQGTPECCRHCARKWRETDALALLSTLNSRLSTAAAPRQRSYQLFGCGAAALGRDLGDHAGL